MAVEDSVIAVAAEARVVVSARRAADAVVLVVTEEAVVEAAAAAAVVVVEVAAVRVGVAGALSCSKKWEQHARSDTVIRRQFNAASHPALFLFQQHAGRRKGCD